MELTGKLIQILPQESGVGKMGKEWKKTPFIIETGDQYPKKIALSAWGQTVDIVQNLTLGEELTCSVNIESREFNDRWYTDVKVWKVERVGYAPAPAPPAYTAPPEQPETEQTDDLPF